MNTLLRGFALSTQFNNLLLLLLLLKLRKQSKINRKEFYSHHARNESIRNVHRWKRSRLDTALSVPDLRAFWKHGIFLDCIDVHCRVGRELIQCGRVRELVYQAFTICDFIVEVSRDSVHSTANLFEESDWDKTSQWRNPIKWIGHQEESQILTWRLSKVFIQNKRTISFEDQITYPSSDTAF